MLVAVAMYATIAILVVFIVIGFFLTVSAISQASRENRLAEGGEDRKLTLRERARRYEGPIVPGMAFFNPVARVGIEFASAICGFPGLGWIVSGNVLIGVILMATIPAFVWAFFPVYVTMSGALATSPFVIVRYLPVVALTSAVCLAISQLLVARRGDKNYDR